MPPVQFFPMTNLFFFALSFFTDRLLQVVQHTMSLLAALTELEPELCSVMLSSPGLGPALEFSLLHTPEKLVRREVSTGVLRMAIQLRETSKVSKQTDTHHGGGGCRWVSFVLAFSATTREGTISGECACCFGSQRCGRGAS